LVSRFWPLVSSLPIDRISARMAGARVLERIGEHRLPLYGAGP
jgi:hypothetical protein